MRWLFLAVRLLLSRAGSMQVARRCCRANDCRRVKLGQAEPAAQQEADHHQPARAQGQRSPLPVSGCSWWWSSEFWRIIAHVNTPSALCFAASWAVEGVWKCYTFLSCPVLSIPPLDSMDVYNTPRPPSISRVMPIDSPPTTQLPNRPAGP